MGESRAGVFVHALETVVGAGGADPTTLFTNDVHSGSPDPCDLATLEERVADAAMAVAGVDEEQEFAIFLRGDAGEILAGISGMVLGGGCELQAMWVDESLRRRCIAGALLTAAEAEA